MHISIYNVLLYMILYDGNCILPIYLVGQSLGISISFINKG